MTTATLARRESAHRRGVTINLRAPAAIRDLIDRAAALLGKSRSEFMLDSARRSAEDVLLDQTFIKLDKQQFTEFQMILEHPPKPTEELRNLLKTKAPWET